jgi:hypothetical protein
MRTNDVSFNPEINSWRSRGDDKKGKKGFLSKPLQSQQKNQCSHSDSFHQILRQRKASSSHPFQANQTRSLEQIWWRGHRSLLKD